MDAFMFSCNAILQLYIYFCFRFSPGSRVPFHFVIKRFLVFEINTIFRKKMKARMTLQRLS